MVQMKSGQEIDKQLRMAQGWASASETKHEDKTYEEGVETALRWALGQDDNDPIDAEFSYDDILDEDDPLG